MAWRTECRVVWKYSLLQVLSRPWIDSGVEQVIVRRQRKCTSYNPSCLEVFHGGSNNGLGVVAKDVASFMTPADRTFLHDPFSLQLRHVIINVVLHDVGSDTNFIPCSSLWRSGGVNFDKCGRQHRVSRRATYLILTGRYTQRWS